MDIAIRSHDPAKRLWKTRYGITAQVSTQEPVVRSLQQYGEWMEHELDLLSGLVQEGQTTLEFGGDFGAHSLWLSQVVGQTGHVHVVEPRRLEFQQLCANLALNQLLNVYTHSAWLGRDAGMLPLGELMDAGCAADAGSRVRSVSLDSLSLEALHLLKVNLPGTLAGILREADETIRRCRPAIYARLGNPEQAVVEVRMLKEAGYRCWSHLPYLFNRDNFAGYDDNLFPGCVSANIIATPVEARMEFERLQEL